MENTQLIALCLSDTVLAGTIPDAFSNDFFRMQLHGTEYFSGTIPTTWGAANFRMIFVANVERMSGTIPELLWHQELGIGTYKTMPSVSGTVPADYHPAHAAAQRPAGSPAIHMPGIGYLAIFYVPFSGTLPHTFFCNGNNSAFKHSNHAIVAGSHLSGTVPPCMFEEAERMKVVCLQHQRLSGIIPDLSGSNDMLVFRVEENNFDTLPPAFPSNLEHFMSADNPRMDYRGTHLATLLNASYDLKDFSFSSDNMVARSLEYSLMQSQHKIPEMGFSAIQPAVPLDCHVGESCAIHLTVIIGNQLLPMNSIGLNFEIRLNPNSSVNSPAHFMFFLLNLPGSSPTIARTHPSCPLLLCRSWMTTYSLCEITCDKSSCSGSGIEMSVQAPIKAAVRCKKLMRPRCSKRKKTNLMSSRQTRSAGSAGWRG